MITGDVESLLVVGIGKGTVEATGALSDGCPCLSHRCVTCCLETEMPLTEGDVKRIEKLGFNHSDFTVEAEGETLLRNVNKICFFLKDGKCSVYEGRPEGCRIYPLVYDVDAHKFVYDTVCPHAAEFRATSEDKDVLKRLIMRLDREARKRA